MRCALAAAVLAAAAPGPALLDVAAISGLRFRHFTGAAGEYHLPEIIGSGGALLDYDGDGDLDVLLLQGAERERTAARVPRFPLPPGHPPGARLFRNDLERDGDARRLRFTDVTDDAGLRFDAYGMGAAVADYDNDGDPDVYLTAFGANVLLRNDGGRFRDVTTEAGVAEERWSTSAAFFDYDRDGDLDLFVANYVDFTPAANKRCFDAVGARDYCLPSVYRPLADRLFRNEGGRFRDVSEAAGITRADGPGLGVAAGDFDDDGWLDVYVANDGTANQLWMNRGDGTFEDRGLLSGTAYNADGLPEGSMGIAAADLDADGDDDLLVTNLPRQASTLYVNQGRGLFHDATDAWGLSVPSAPYTGFGAVFFDYDLDGWLDLFVANGAVTIVESLRGSAYPFQERSQLFHHPGAPPFEDVSARSGMTASEVSRGVAAGDVDNDGDLDLLVTNNNGPPRLLLNQARRRGSFLQVRLVGSIDNRDGLGARVGVVRDGAPTLWRRAATDGSYLSAGDPRVHFGLGHAPARDLVVAWPSGRRESWPVGGTDRLVTLTQGTGRVASP